MRGGPRAPATWPDLRLPITPPYPPMGRYFPEVVARVATIGPDRFVLDGELIVPVAGEPSFDDLLQRIR